MKKKKKKKKQQQQKQKHYTLWENFFVCLFTKIKLKIWRINFLKVFRDGLPVLRIGRYCASNGTKWGLNYFKKFSTTEIISYVMQMYSGLHQYYRRQHFIHTWPSGGLKTSAFGLGFPYLPLDFVNVKLYETVICHLHTDTFIADLNQ